MSNTTQGFQSKDELIKHLQKQIKEWVAERDYFEKLNNENYDKNLSLTTTIESQKVEYEQLEQRMEKVNQRAAEDCNNYDAERDKNELLLGQIQSQKEEIENQIDINIKQDSLITHLKKQLKESQAITELAVKGLKEIKIVSETASVKIYQKSDSILSEIERLQNE